MDSSHTQMTASGQQTPTKVAGILRHFEKHPSATSFINKYDTAIKAVTGVGFVAHFLRIRSSIDAQEAAVASNSVSSAKKFRPIRRAGVAGAAWSLVWFGVLGVTTLAEESIHRRIDPVALQRRSKVPWKVELASGGKEEAHT